MEFLRQDLQRLGEQDHGLRVYGDLSGLGAERITLHADNVADIHLFEIRIRFLTDGVSRNIDLDFAVPVLHMAERSLAHDTFQHDTSCNGNMDR